MLGIFANANHPAFAPDYLAVFTYFLYRGSDFHT